MARGGKKGRGRGRNRGGGRGGGWGARADYQEISRHNDKFEQYYDALNIVAEDERAEFWEACRTGLPNSFRFTGSRGHALSVQQRLIDHYIPKIVEVKFNEQFVSPPEPIEWFPERLAWSMTTPKQIVRKFAPFASFQKFLVSETNVGNISRQEVVSMIPPLLMDLKPGMTVLDMCAAPGSKSTQLIELLHAGEEARVRNVLHDVAQRQGREMSPDGTEIKYNAELAEKEGLWNDSGDDGRATGLLIANDADNKRAHMLVHQTKRLHSPNLIVTNHDATMFPSIRMDSEPGKPQKYLKFDRILADVPCSGDGTCRKNVNIWKDWLPGNALGLHATQEKILVRALQMLKVGGRVVYSTCSMNPVENEAVIASAIDRCGGLSKVKIIDCSAGLPGLKRRPGLTEWEVMDKNGDMWESWEQVGRYIGTNDPGRLVSGMFPPASISEEARIPLEHCVRIYPHLQDTGAFFITILEKLSEIKARPPAEKVKAKAGSPAKATEAYKKGDGESNQSEERPNKRPRTGDEAESGDALERQEEPLPKRLKNEDLTVGPSSSATNGEAKDVILKSDPEEAPAGVASGGEQIQDSGVRSLPGNAFAAPTADPFMTKKANVVFEEPFKYLDPEHEVLQQIYSFYQLSPRFPRDRFMVRNATGEPVKAIYYTSALVREIHTNNEGKGIKFVHSGVKMFMKQDAQGQDTCRWRIQSEGIGIIEGWVGERRIVRLYKRETLRRLLIEMFPRIGGGGWMELGEIGERVRDIRMGCCVLRVEFSDAEDGFKERLVMPLWRSLDSLNLMLPKEERKAMLLRIYNDDSPLIDNSQARKDKHIPVDDAELPPSQDQEESDGEDNGVPLPMDIDENDLATDEAGMVAKIMEEPDVKKASDMKLPSETNGTVQAKGPLHDPHLVVEKGEAEKKPVAFGLPTSDVENGIQEAEDMLKAEMQHERDTTKEIAPGVKDEEDVFNKTV